jgi:6-phosphogluconolactonase|tara:strand:- start:2492 stop:3160 length:669 start_codon:yes stop_codon:yes gene_type:complete
MKTIKKSTENSLINHFIYILKKKALRKKERNQRLSLVLTGGKSPINLYKQLAINKIDWTNIDLFWGDERFVSKRSKNSNYKLAYDTFIKKINISKNNIFSVNTNIKNISKCSQNYSNLIKKYFKKKKICFDIFLLGMGKDGHVASIFPNSNELSEKFITHTVIRKDFKRITLSLNLINNSKNIIVWLNNKNKIKKFNKLRFKGNNIPINNLKKNKTLLFRII